MWLYVLYCVIDVPSHGLREGVHKRWLWLSDGEVRIVSGHYILSFHEQLGKVVYIWSFTMIANLQLFHRIRWFWLALHRIRTVAFLAIIWWLVTFSFLEWAHLDHCAIDFSEQRAAWFRTCVWSHVFKGYLNSSYGTNTAKFFYLTLRTFLQSLLYLQTQ